MKVYNITKDKINIFTSLSNDKSSFRKTVESLWNNGLSLPEWCFVIEEKDKVVGGVGYWAPTDNKKDIHMFGLFLPWKSEDCQSIGQMLINKSLEMMKIQGAKSVDYQLHLDDDISSILRRQIFEIIGMKQIQSKKSFLISKESYEYEDKNRLVYKSLDEVGEDFFIDIIKKVTRGTLDQEDKMSVLNLGEMKAAEDLFSILKSIDFSANDWFISYKDNEPTGLIVPQKLESNMGAINYIGVIPDKRGWGICNRFIR